MMVKATSTQDDQRNNQGMGSLYERKIIVELCSPDDTFR